TWISAPTPVINRVNTADSGSTRSPNSTCRSATGSHEYNVVSAPPATSLLMNVITAYTKDMLTVAHPSRCPHGLVRLPPTSRTTAPSAGKKISSHDAAITMSPLPVGSRCPLAAPPHKPLSIHSLVLQQVGVVDRSRPASAENR